MRDEHPQELRRVVIKEELVKLTGHWRTALILNQFLYWLQRHRHYNQFLAVEQARNPDLQGPVTHGWIYKSAKELQDELMIDVSEVTLRRDIKVLVDRQWLASSSGVGGRTYIRRLGLLAPNVSKLRRVSSSDSSLAPPSYVGSLDWTQSSSQ